MIRRRFVVAGLVQGVGFRYSTRVRARELGVTGWARNLPDGRVEGEAQGDADAVERLIAWLSTGPPSAEVESVEVHEAQVIPEESAFGVA